MTDLKPIPNVTDEQYDGRDFVGEDNTDGVEHYVGVDPIYQTYANETEKPYPFSDEELDEASRRGGVDPDDEADDDEDEAEVDSKSDTTKATSTATSAKKSTAPKAPVPPQRATEDK